MKRADDLAWYDDYEEIVADDIIEVVSGPDNEPGKEDSGIKKVLINEIAWMGTRAFSSDEWIELYNPNSEPIDLSGWYFEFMPLIGEIRTIALDNDTPSISGLGYFLLERTDDSSVSDIPADYIYKGALNDECSFLELRDNNGNLIDRVDCLEGKWPAGQKQARVSMERAENNSWASNNLFARAGKDAQENYIWGTPRSQNSVSISGLEISALPFDYFDEIILPLTSSPYIIKRNIQIPENKTLIIEPDVVVKFYNEYSGIRVLGTLKADNVVFTSFKDDEFAGDTNNDQDNSIPQKGDWDSIYFSPESKDSELKNIILRYGGGGEKKGYCSYNMAGIKAETDSLLIEGSVFEHNQGRAVYLLNSSAVIDNVQITNTGFCPGGANDYLGWGISVQGGSPTIKNSLIKSNLVGIYVLESASPKIENNIFEQNEKAVWVNVAYPLFSKNTAQNNQINGIFVRGTPGFIGQDAVWQANMPYVIDSTFRIKENAVLTIEPGAVIQFYDRYSGLFVDGTLMADNVEFTSFKENPGPESWDKIYFSPTSTGSELNNVSFNYAGGGDMEPCSFNMSSIKVEKSSISLKNSVINNSQYKGIYLVDSDSVLENVEIKNTSKCLDKYGGWGIHVEGGNPVFENLVFENNAECNVFQNGECYPNVPDFPDVLEPPLIIPTVTP